LLAADEYSKDYDDRSPKIVLSTAHASKFLDVVENEIDRKVSIPDRLVKATRRGEKSLPLSSDYPELKKMLLKTYGR
jgi:threonine synthase